MRPTPIPQDEVWDGGRRFVIAPPDNDPTNTTIAPVEAIVDQDELGTRFCIRMVLDDADVARVAAGQRVFWYAQRGEHLHPFWIGLGGRVVNIVYRPIVVWPGQLTPQRRETPYYARIDETWQLLKKEAAYVGGRELVVQLALHESQIRLDGKPRAGAQPTHPGVIVSFESRYGPLRYATDAFTHWHANLRAIALGLEALRKVDRYGISKRGEQYTGWSALPAGSNGHQPLTLEKAALFIATYSGDTAISLLGASTEILQIAYRKAARRLHPDTGGDAALFARLQEAKQLLEGGTR